MSNYEDKAEIIEVLNLYAFALDSRRWDLFEQVFTEDIRTELGPASAAWTSRAQLIEAFDLFHKTLDGHAHTMSGHLVHVDGDTAYSFTYGDWLLIRNDAVGGPNWTGTGWYDDLLVRTDQGWRIKHRIARQIGYSGNVNVPQPVGDQTPDQTGHALSDEVGEIRYFQAIKAK